MKWTRSKFLDKFNGRTNFFTGQSKLFYTRLVSMSFSHYHSNGNPTQTRRGGKGEDLLAIAHCNIHPTHPSSKNIAIKNVSRTLKAVKVLYNGNRMHYGLSFLLIDMHSFMRCIKYLFIIHALYSCAVSIYLSHSCMRYIRSFMPRTHLLCVTFIHAIIHALHWLIFSSTAFIRVHALSPVVSTLIDLSHTRSHAS